MSCLNFPIAPVGVMSLSPVLRAATSDNTKVMVVVLAGAAS